VTSRVDLMYYDKLFAMFALCVQTVASSKAPMNFRLEIF